tara:strand:+ start:299 stop:508 length:210 start_codon:yes stop_codon:yes gene_type:complete
MKLYCADFDNCGFEKTYEDHEPAPDNICPACFNFALVYSDNYIPIFIKEDLEREAQIESLLLYYLVKNS